MNCYNGDAYLRQAIDSVFAQDFSDWEIIFWDNQSTDNSASIAKSYNDPRFKYFCAEQHTKLHEARRSALEKASGEYLCFLDTDDYWLPGKLSAQFAILEESERLGNPAALVYGRSRILSPEGEIAPPLADRPLPEGMVFDELLKVNFIPLLTVVVRRAVFDSAGGIDPAMSQAGDYAAWLRITRNHPVRALQSYCAVYRWHPANLSQKKAFRLWFETFHLKVLRYHHLDRDVVVSLWRIWFQWMLTQARPIARRVRSILRRVFGGS